MDFSTLWWSRVPNAADFITNAGDAIVAGHKSLVLSLPPTLPWRSAFEDQLTHYVRERNSENTFYYIDSPTSNVGETLFKQFCSEEIALDYRPTQSYPQFLAAQHAIGLNHRYIWVRNIPVSCLPEWTSFLRDYHTHAQDAPDAAVFILEVTQSLGAAKTRGLTYHYYQDAISLFDAYTFCMMGISKLAISHKDYLLELIFSICQEDIHLCACCIENASALLHTSVVDMPALLALWNGAPSIYSVDSLTKKVWAAQVKTLFPIIEDTRGKLVEKYHSAIDAHLPLQSSGSDMYNIPEDVEVGTLHYMVTCGMLAVSSSDAALIARLRNARNDLAHLSVLDLAEIHDICP